MARRTSPRPTDAELEILSVLWERGPGTVREIQAALRPLRDSGYTTVLKLLQIMVEKGLVERDASTRAHCYRPAQAKESVQRRLVGDLLQRAFGGSAQDLMMRALASKSVSPDELARIRERIEELEEDAR